MPTTGTSPVMAVAYFLSGKKLKTMACPFSFFSVYDHYNLVLKVTKSNADT
jgi:hypothetical protein